MTALDTTLRDKVYDTIQTYGKELTFYTNAGGGVGTYDPATGAYASLPTTLTYTYKTSPPAMFIRSFGEGLAEEAGCEVILPAKDLNSDFESGNLKPEMKVDFDSGRWLVTSVESQYSGDEICAYKLTMKQRKFA